MIEVKDETGDGYPTFTITGPPWLLPLLRDAIRKLRDEEAHEPGTRRVLAERDAAHVGIGLFSHGHALQVKLYRER